MNELAARLVFVARGTATSSIAIDATRAGCGWRE
jgi:hypothetical protein